MNNIKDKLLDTYIHSVDIYFPNGNIASYVIDNLNIFGIEVNPHTNEVLVETKRDVLLFCSLPSAITLRKRPITKIGRSSRDFINLASRRTKKD